MEIAERHIDVDGLEVHLRQAGERPVLYVHGVPTASWEWVPFLERTGGVAPDLPGFGSSDKPVGFDYSISGYDRFLESFCDRARLDRFSLVVHDWGSVALAFAQRFPERIERLVLLGCVPLLPGYRWHRVARAWRTPLVGEMLMGMSTRWSSRQLSKEANLTPGPVPEEYVEAIWDDFDHGTQRAILKLYRSAAPEVLARHGAGLGELRCPALILWPSRDPYIGPEFGQLFADALGGEVELEMVEAGHWPWLDRPDLIERTGAFLDG